MKGMHEKAAQGIFPARAPFGYRNNKANRTIEAHPENSIIVKRMFALYASGTHTLSTLAKTIHREMGKKISKAGVHLILQNYFYVGLMTWGGKQYPGAHELFITPQTFNEVQAVLTGHNRPKYAKREVALRGLMNCAHDGCMLTGDVQKEKYIYYRCTGHRGKCGLPRFREEDTVFSPPPQQSRRNRPSSRPHPLEGTQPSPSCCEDFRNENNTSHKSPTNTDSPL